jgi:hypothetical protein
MSINLHPFFSVSTGPQIPTEAAGQHLRGQLSNELAPIFEGLAVPNDSGVKMALFCPECSPLYVDGEKEIKVTAKPWGKKNGERSSTNARHINYRVLFSNILSSGNNTSLIRGQKKNNISLQIITLTVFTLNIESLIRSYISK